MTLIDGRAVASRLREKIKREVEALKEGKGITPGLGVVLVGEDPASKIYVGMKERACKEIGIRSYVYRLPQDTSEEEILHLVDYLNKNSEVNGVLVQLPLPGHVSTERVLEAVSPEKDVDGFHPYNVGRLVAGRPSFVPCTPLGIMRLLEEYAIPIEGREAVVVGRSNIVGKPVAHLLLQRNATVTICHSKTRDLPAVVQRAQILVVAAGRPRMVRGEWIRKGAVVIDVGVNRLEDGSLCGDVDFEGAAEKASYITPVPGGVGPMTITMLLHNTLEAARLQTRS